MPRNGLLLGLLLLICSQWTAAQLNEPYLDSDDLYRQGKEFYHKGNYPRAQWAFRQFREQYNLPRDEDNTQIVEAAYMEAISAWRLDSEEAIHLLNDFVKDHGNLRSYNSLANYHLGKLFFKKKKHKEAISCFEEIYPQDLSRVEYEDYRFKEAYSQFNLQQFDRAYPIFEEVSSLRGANSIDANYYVGFLAFEKGEIDKALDHFYKVEDSKRYKQIIPYYITQIYYRQNDDKGLLSYTIPKLKNNSLKYKTQMNKMVGITYYDQKKFKEALPYLEYYVDKSAKVSKEDLYLLAYTQYQFGKYDEAVANFLELNTLTDQFGQNAMYHLADCYIKLQDKEKARNAFKAAADLDADPEIKKMSAFNYAKLSFELGFHSVAIKSLQTFIADYNGSREEELAKDMLGEVLEVTQNYKEAIAIIEAIPNPTSALKSSYQKIAFSRAIELLNDNKEDAALKHFDKAIDTPIYKDLVAESHFWKGNIFYGKKQYSKSRASLKSYLSAPGRSNDPLISPASANYTMGYTYFSKKNYSKSIPYFEKTASGLKGKKGEGAHIDIYSDAVLRTGDCYFMQRDYNNANKNYNIIIKKDYPSADYALFQSSMIYGLENQYDQKIAGMQQLARKYPKSYYNDDALFQVASTESFQGNQSAAIANYQKLLNDYPKSKYTGQSKVNIGLSYLNMDKNDEAITYFEEVLEQYPNTDEAGEALTNLKEAYLAKGDSEAYFSYLSNNKDIQISTSEQDTIMYQFAERYYEDGDCANAVGEFGKYLTQNPNGAFALFAHFYRGECLYSQKKYQNSRKDYDFVLSRPNNLFTEKALDRRSRIAFTIDKDDAKAFTFFERLFGSASQDGTATEALRGLVRTSFNLKKESDLRKYGKQLLSNKRATKDDKIETHYFLGKTDYNSGSFGEAKTHLDQVAKLTNNVMGAESRYLLADMLVKQNKLDQAKEACFRVDRECSAHEYWVVKSFVLLANIFRQKGDLYQAKATLKSILDNYKGDQSLINEANSTLEAIKAQEKAGSKLDDGTGNDSELLELDEDEDID